MSNKIIKKGLATQGEIIEGVVKAVEAIKTTLGPSGKCVAIDNMIGPEVTRDGATVAKSISFKDPAQNMGAQLVRKASTRTEEQAGDATSTTAILISEFCVRGQKALSTGSNVNEIKSGMLKAEKWMSDYIKKNSIPIDGDLEKIRKVATISANNDPEVGDLVVECMEKVGIDGLITADLTSGLDTVIDVTTGMKLERGWASPQYVTTPADGKCTMDNPYILVAGERISSVNQIIGIIEPIVKSGKPFLIICDDMDEVVNATLVMNTLSGALRCCVVKGIDFGDGRRNIMEDIAVAVGAKHFCPEIGSSVTDATLQDLGVAKKVVISRDNTIIYEGAGDPEEITERVEILKSRLQDPSVSDYDKTKFSKRIAGLAGGIAIIKAGGASETEKINRKATIEDSILASKSAIEEGCVPGGGYIYYKGSLDVMKDKAFWKSLKGDEKEGAEIVFSSLPCILRTIVENSGANSSDIVLDTVRKSTKKSWGYNAKTKKFGYLLEEGVLDSAKVIRVALENSVSTAAMILLTDCIIIEEPEEGNKEE